MPFSCFIGEYMPIFFITPNSDERVFARFDKNNISWTTLSRTTPFESSQQARDGFDSAFQELLVRAKALSATALQTGNLVRRNDGLFQHGALTSEKAQSLFMPRWVERLRLGFWVGGSPTWKDSPLRIVGKGAEMELMKSFDRFYVRHDSKWLGHPATHSKASHDWVANLDQAQAFCTYEDALAAKARHAHPEDNCWIVKTTSRVAAAIPLIANAADADEPFMGLIKASCEAKHERLAIDAAISSAEPTAPEGKPARSKKRRL